MACAKPALAVSNTLGSTKLTAIPEMRAKPGAPGALTGAWVKIMAGVHDRTCPASYMW
jgi:hypothetical protein